MSEKNKYKIFTSTDCLSEQAMFDYMDGKLSPKEQHVAEKHLLDCELCSDAIEGLELLKSRSRITDINKEINKRVAGQERKIFSINYTAVISIAAALVLLMGGVYFFNHFVTDQLKHSNEISILKTPEEKPTSISPLSENDSGKQNSVISKNKISSGKDENSETRVLEDQEAPTNTAEQLKQTDNSVTGKRVAEEENDIVSIPAQPASPDEKDQKITTTETTTQSQTIAQDKSATKYDYNNNAAGERTEESKNEKSNADGYSADERAITKDSEKAIVFQSESKKKEKQYKTEEAQKPVAGNVPYSPQNSVQMDADQKPRIDSINIPEEPVYTNADQMPQFPGGEKELIKYFQENIAWSNLSKNEKETISGSTIQVVINPNGKVSKIKFLKPLNKENEKKITELINKMPPWTPGKLNGKVVSVLYNLPPLVEKK